eukprot:TRINITY_DN25122_c0_g1_i1.p1 TRINITY_DN25122_c0_g1~~TRINITY_DN25122_c0_g1_i1.p1  ORF type:complete len:136 (+),score=33.31 TRINITY_DN25122_c0_g1_i1:47-409(+)
MAKTGKQMKILALLLASLLLGLVRGQGDDLKPGECNVETKADCDDDELKLIDELEGKSHDHVHDTAKAFHKEHRAHKKTPADQRDDDWHKTHDWQLRKVRIILHYQKKHFIAGTDKVKEL